MISLSQTSAYAIHALTCLEREKGQPSLIRDIAATTGAPKSYLAKIINQLHHRGLIKAKRGHNGGISLSRPAREISLLEIVEAIEGESWIATCPLGVERCRRTKVCPTHRSWQSLRAQMRQMLQETTLADTVPFAGAHAARAEPRRAAA